MQDQAAACCAWASAFDRAEWEYAAAGGKSSVPWGDVRPGAKCDRAARHVGSLVADGFPDTARELLPSRDEHGWAVDMAGMSAVDRRLVHSPPEAALDPKGRRQADRITAGRGDTPDDVAT
jgi:hypothetical protein